MNLDQFWRALGARSLTGSELLQLVPLRHREELRARLPELVASGQLIPRNLEPPSSPVAVSAYRASVRRF